MKFKSTKWLPFDANHSYIRRYNRYFFQDNADRIHGDALDIGAKSDDIDRYQQWSGQLDSYTSLDIADNPSLDIRADGRRLPFENDSFDTVLMSEVIEHIPVSDASTILSEVNRVLRVGGSLLLSVPFVHHLHEEPHDYLRPTKYGLYELLEEAGFDQEVHVGGGYGEHLLHLLFQPYNGIVGGVFGDTGTKSFVMIHLLIRTIAFCLSVPYGYLSTSDRQSRYYLTQFAIGTKR